jgi:hypothetical protein
MTPLIISYYTKNTIYEKEVEGLIETCNELDLNCSIEGVQDLGSWEKNCCFKPTFIYQKLMEFKRPVLWVDCDAVILKEPACFDCDIALTINEKLDISDHSKILAGTIFVDYSPQSLEFIKAWEKMIIEEIEKKEKRMDLIEQECLRDLIFSQKSLKIAPLPMGYCYIFDEESHNLEAKDIFIVHFQASRLRFFLDDFRRTTPLFYKNIDQLKLKLLRQKIKIPVHDLNDSAVETYLYLIKSK